LKNYLPYLKVAKLRHPVYRSSSLKLQSQLSGQPQIEAKRFWY